MSKRYVGTTIIQVLIDDATRVGFVIMRDVIGLIDKRKGGDPVSFFVHNVAHSDAEKSCEKEVVEVLSSLPEDVVREIAYLFYEIVWRRGDKISNLSTHEVKVTFDEFKEIVTFATIRYYLLQLTRKNPAINLLLKNGWLEWKNAEGWEKVVHYALHVGSSEELINHAFRSNPCTSQGKRRSP